MIDLWPRIEAVLPQAERPARYIDHEWGVQRNAQATYHFCMVYPDTYELGQANQALRILCNAVNADVSMEAQRAFLPAPEFCDVLRAHGIPLFSLESCSPLKDFDAIGITLSHELSATNVLEALDLSEIPLHAKDRTSDMPIVIAGGPCTLNPEPYAPFFDVFSIGEGEESVPELLKRHRELKEKGLSRSTILEELARIPGTYVPALYEWLGQQKAQKEGSYVVPQSEKAPRLITRRIFEDFAISPAFEPCIVPFAEVVHDRLNVEVLRGCTRGCRFCQAGMMYRPVRERSAENIVAGTIQGLHETGYDEVSLTSLSTTDHSQIGEILTKLNHLCSGKGIRISIPSQRLDSFGVEMATCVAGQKRGGLTFAPEAGSQRLRDAINKNVTEQDLLQAIEAAFTQGWRRCKLYFMIGLPTETDEDVAAIADLAEKAFAKAKEMVEPSQRGNIKIGLSVALFVPKPQTPFQWDGQIAPDEALRRIGLIRAALKSRAIDLSWHDPTTSFIEAAMSRGGRECAAWVEEAWKHGARFDAWTEHFNEQAWSDAAAALDFDPHALAQSSVPPDVVMPWFHIDMGVNIEFLKAERLRAESGEVTPDCSFDVCSACGVCTDFEIGPDIQGVRHG